MPGSASPASAGRTWRRVSGGASVSRCAAEPRCPDAAGGSRSRYCEATGHLSWPSRRASDDGFVPVSALKHRDPSLRDCLDLCGMVDPGSDCTLGRTRSANSGRHWRLSGDPFRPRFWESYKSLIHQGPCEHSQRCAPVWRATSESVREFASSL